MHSPESKKLFSILKIMKLHVKKKMIYSHNWNYTMLNLFFFFNMTHCGFSEERHETELQSVNCQ